MDETDRELIRLLSLDARRPASELARDLGVSRPTIQNRIDKLKASGAITRFTIELGDQANGALIDALVLVKLKPGDSRSVVAQFAKLAGVEAITSSNGAFDFILELRVSSLQNLDHLLVDIRRMPMVADTNSSIRLNKFK